ncbi:hypothetical protein I5495_01500 [Citrobacter amalonaticus]|uniref:hypothetical protein n=1 Tax=Citrobacter amalonaticus TaxID=35703 RepID=UPI0019086F55|nr:hypothetical protein [Citrobacter amalonaticus]MBJ9256026.1 hypothetical protein [Citrobacter amalonaticus]
MYPFVRSVCPDYLNTCWQALGIRFRDARARNPRYKFIWYAKFQKDESLRRLLEMTKGHCAFCDGANLGAESRKTIEHFRPKSEFHTLAYQWENLYPCCDQCQSAKGEDFDEGLLAGDQAGYAFESYFSLDYSSGAILPNPVASDNDQQRARITIAFYGLNVEERKIARKRQHKFYQSRPDDMHLDDFSYRFYLTDA